jgi:hypothetical protein
MSEEILRLLGELCATAQEVAVTLGAERINARKNATSFQIQSVRYSKCHLDRSGVGDAASRPAVFRFRPARARGEGRDTGTSYQQLFPEHFAAHVARNPTLADFAGRFGAVAQDRLTICSPTVIRMHAAATKNSTFPTIPSAGDSFAPTATTSVCGVGMDRGRNSGVGEQSSFCMVTPA